jgi:polyhydroxybutyrate depolymerase
MTAAASVPTDPPALVALDASVHLPSSLPAGQRAPLLVMLHGLGSSGDDIASSDWPGFAAAHGVAWMAPSGPKDSKGRRFWNAGASCCNFDGVAVDHVAQLRALIQQKLATEPLDAARVFVGGYSNGGFMAHRLACEAPDLVAGIVSMAGSGPLEAVKCGAAKSLRVLQIQGDADRVVPYAGGHLFNDPRLPEHASAQKTVTDWAERLGCKVTSSSEAPFDFEARLPGAETRPTVFKDCKAGRVALWTVAGGDHFIGFRAPAPETIWRFLTE